MTASLHPPSSVETSTARPTLSDAARARSTRLRGKASVEASIRPAATALVVIDMQNYFVAPGFAGEVPAAREIVPTIDRLAAALRVAGGLVLWVQTVTDEARSRWPRHHDEFLAPANAERRIAGMARGSPGFALYPSLHPQPQDLRLTKVHYSAFIPGSSDIDAQLRARGIDTLLIAGTATNICCESSARDASMLGYRTIMVADANATWTTREQDVSLEAFATFFGDVLGADEVLQRIA